jgi:hypothetical protein
MLYSRADNNERIPVFIRFKGTWFVLTPFERSNKANFAPFCLLKDKTYMRRLFFNE